MIEIVTIAKDEKVVNLKLFFLEYIVITSDFVI